MNAWTSCRFVIALTENGREYQDLCKQPWPCKGEKLHLRMGIEMEEKPVENTCNGGNNKKHLAIAVKHNSSLKQGDTTFYFMNTPKQVPYVQLRKGFEREEREGENENGKGGWVGLKKEC
uniref:Uncharacterized protein n=1 Tax=Medicago truncatula TaxID=3880 RepID=Q2HSX2_MEDTR|nr:hypothetical protein MtrDRAFT_AC150891g4v2 [Medicago truncatula]